MFENRPTLGKWIAAVLVMCGLAAVLRNMVADNMPKGEVRVVEGYTPWDPATLAAAEAVPVQDGGRIKPLSTQAGFTMLALHGARSMKVSDGSETHRIKPAAWMLDALFRPQFSMKQPTFRVDNSDALKAIGVTVRGRRDRYSYEDIRPGIDRLLELAESYAAIEKNKRDPMQSQVLDLAANLRSYEALLGYFTFARAGIPLPGSGGEGEPDRRARVSDLMSVAPEIRAEVRKSGQRPPEGLKRLIDGVVDTANASRAGLFLIPPADPKEKDWRSAGTVIWDVMNGKVAEPAPLIESIRLLESLDPAGKAGEPGFRDALGKFAGHVTEKAAARGEGRFVGLEAQYYRKNWFLHALAWFLAGTLFALAMWTLGNGRTATAMAWATALTTAAGLTYCVIAIVKRCVIMQRPPVGNLYDTIIFIGTTVVMLCLLLEWMSRKRLALGLAPVLGTALIILARRFELGDAQDHMDPLVAVLDSNFWLTTHVITITLGYSAGLLSAFLSAAYILMRGLGLDRADRDLRRSQTRTVYGMLCFTLFLSLVGTVLGGIWANDSWGRFWGWDPKENGALLIVLWTLAILHARLGGFIREWGIHLASVFTAVVVAFSWWHVNFLGVGLHNYGFTAGKDTIWSFYGAMVVLLLFGFVARAMESRSSGKPENMPAAVPSEQ